MVRARCDWPDLGLTGPDLAVLMTGIADVLTSDHMRVAFMLPERRAELREELNREATGAFGGAAA